MSDLSFQPGRRQALKAAAATIVTISLPGFARQGQAQGAPKLSPDDPMAKSLRYVEDASKATRPPKGDVPGEQQLCSNCQFLQAGEGEWRPCSIFGGKLVNVNGWCSAWAKKA
jgi:hypothetical protein